MVKTFVIAAFCRFLLSTGRRFAYPFAPAFSRELGVGLPAIGVMIAFSQASSILGIFFGPLIDRVGYRRMMIAGMCLFAVGAFCAGTAPFFFVLVPAMFIIGLGRSIFDPAIQAYIGSQVPFARRGYVIGLLETTWAASTLIGIPLIGLLLQHLGFRSPFFVLCGLGIVCILALQRFMPKPKPEDLKPADTIQTHRRIWRDILSNPAAIGAMVFAFFFSAANDTLFIVYGVWLEQTFSFSLTGISLGACIIGAAELSGEMLTVWFADRIGLKRAVIIGMIISIFCYAVLPLFQHNYLLPLLLVGIIFLSFEFTAVSFISLCTEIAPQTRAAMMAAAIAAGGTGRVFGNIIGSIIWPCWNIQGIALASIIMISIALSAVILGLKHWR